MKLHRASPCKVNFVLNILGRRPDGFHELETLFFPVPLFDEITAEAAPAGIQLTCSNPDLPVDQANLVWRAANSFFQATRLAAGAVLHLQKNLPLAAGIGAGSANAAVTLLLLNELFGHPLNEAQLHAVAATLGSDVNFFLQPDPAIAVGRGEQIQPLASFKALRGWTLFLYRPGFGVPTPWAFKELAKYPDQLNGRPGRALDSARLFAEGQLDRACPTLFNSLELPVFGKYPMLSLYQEFLRANGATAALMSGSGSTTFALFPDPAEAKRSAARFREQFGSEGWLALASL